MIFWCVCVIAYAPLGPLWHPASPNSCQAARILFQTPNIFPPLFEDGISPLSQRVCEMQ